GAVSGPVRPPARPGRWPVGPSPRNAPPPRGTGRRSVRSAGVAAGSAGIAAGSAPTGAGASRFGSPAAHGVSADFDWI
ncbi:hypothetical protein ABT215_20810, partial [Streptomyces sp900105755]